MCDICICAHVVTFVGSALCSPCFGVVSAIIAGDRHGLGTELDVDVALEKTRMLRGNLRG